MDLNSVEVFEMAYDRFGNLFGDSPEDIVAQKCSDCGKVKYLDGFHRDRTRKTGFDARCSACKKSEYYRRYKRTWSQNNKEKVADAQKRWRINNPNRAKEIGRVAYLRRLARKKSLPDTLSNKQAEVIIERFEGCVLTGSLDFHLDHVLPLSIGHGGTTAENIVPLRSDLNLSKNAHNVFEWFNENKDRFNLDQAKFDALIEYLAKLNDMTIDEYRDYVYWCHANPRDVAN